jgi:hypothetical protein
MQLGARSVVGPVLPTHDMPTMKSPMNTLSLFCSVALLALGFSAAQAQTAQNAPQSMRFFVTSAGSGKGGDLGGLAGADAHCQSLAAAAGAGTRTWHAYLSTQATVGNPTVNARDRIGNGPWYNAKATLIARDLNELHGMNMLTKQTALTEKGAVVNGRGECGCMYFVVRAKIENIGFAHGAAGNGITLEGGVQGSPM